MALFRQGRLAYLIAKELSHKYTKALTLGFISGLVLSLGLSRLWPTIAQQLFAPIDRVGVVAESTANTLPYAIQNLISMGLTTMADDGTIKPALAKSWEATDSGKTFVFHLAPDKTWQNSTFVDAKDINYNIQNVRFSVLGPTTIAAHLNAPYSPFPALVSRPLFLSGLMGLGDYKMQTIKLKGDTVDYLKLIDRTGQKRSKEFRFYRTEVMAITAYKMGDIDVIGDLASDPKLNGWGKTKVEKKTNYKRIVSLFFNLQQDVLKEKAFRQALAYGVPDLPFERAISPIPKTSWGFTDKVKRYTYNPTQVKKLFAAAKIGTESAQLTISTFPQYVDVAQQIAGSWSDLGIPTTVKVESSVPATYQVLLSAQDVPLDPDQYPLWHSTQLATNITHYANVKIDKLLEDGRQELDQEKRKKIYADFQRFIIDDLPAVFLYYPPTYTVTRQ